MRKMITALMVTMMVLTGCGNKTPLKTAYEKADVPVGALKYIDYGDDWSFISVDTNPNDEEDFYAEDAYNIVRNLNQSLEFPESVLNHMMKTTWSQGIQTYEGKKFEASWTYHPDKGLCVTYEVADKK